MSRLALSALFICLLSVAGPAAQAPQPPRFSSGIDLLTVDVAVTARDGRPVADLQAGDFTVTVGGQPRKVLFARFYGAGGGDAPLPMLAADPRIAVVSNEATAGGRSVLFVIDRDSMQTGTEKAMLMAAGAVLDALGPSDAAGIVGLPAGRFELTREHARVRDALRHMTGTMPTTPWRWHITWEEAAGIERQDRILLAQVLDRECRPGVAREAGPARVPEGCDKGVVMQATEMLLTARSQTRTTLANLGAIADGLAPLRGPKHIVLISGGLRLDQDVLPDHNTFTAQAARGGVVLHVIHADQPATDSTTARRPVTSAFGGRDMSEGLTAIAGSTGGSFSQGVGTAAGVFDRIATEITNQYQLAVETTEADVAAGVRDVKVSVTRPNVAVRSRAQVAVQATTAARGEALARLLQQPTDIAGLGIAITAYAIRGDEPERLRILIGAAVDTGLPAVAGEWGFTVLNEGNPVASGRRDVTAPAGGAWPITASASLLPGRYRLRFAAVTEDGRSGMLDVPITVGLRAAGDVQTSDLIVGVAEGARLQPRGQVAVGTDLHAMIEVLSGNPERLAKTRAVIEIIPGGTSEPVQRHLMAARSGAIETILLNEARIDTKALPPGRYTASVIVLLDDQPVGRVVRAFDIVAAK